MALPSTTNSLSTIPTSATPSTDTFTRDVLIWLAALAVWFWNDFEARVAGKHLVALAGGVLILGTAVVALAVLR